MNTANYGVIRIKSSSVTFEPDKSVSLVEKYGGLSPLPVTTWDWIKIHKCIRLDFGFNLSARSPSQECSIRFNSMQFRDGVYNLNVPSQHLMEVGTIVNVMEIPDEDAVQDAFAGLLDYRFRFFVKTAATNDRQGTQRDWLIGISTYHIPEVSDFP